MSKPSFGAGLLLFAVVEIGVATTVLPGTAERLRFDRILEEVTIHPSLAPLAFDVLRQAAEGDTDSLPDDVEERFGLRSGELHGPVFQTTPMRAHAYRSLGRLGGEDAARYLESLRIEDFIEDFEGSEFHQLWRAVQIAVREARFAQLLDVGARQAFLEGVLSESHDPVSAFAVGSWAADAICDSGMLTALPIVQQWIYERPLSRERAAMEFEYCERRMNAVRSDSDRVNAIGQLLKITSDPIDQRLIGWAVNKLVKERSPKADRILDQFEAAILALPEASYQRTQLSLFAEQIRGTRIQRALAPDSR